MYLILFRGITDALTEAEKLNIGRMCDILKQAQIESEECYISDSQKYPKKAEKTLDKRTFSAIISKVAKDSRWRKP